MRHVAFVVPFMFETSVRFLRAALRLPDVSIDLITQEPPERFDADIRQRLHGFARVPDALSPEHLVAGVRGLEKEHGPVDRLIGVLEQLQVPLAEARSQLGLPGLSVDAALNFRDKARMKDRMRAVELPCARHRLATTVEDVKAFIDEVGFPIIMKPTAGAGAQNTFRLDHLAQLSEAMAVFPPNREQPMLLEEFILGEEHSFDAVCVGGECVWHSISRYSPGPLEVMENDWIQWAVLLPRQIDGPQYDEIRKVGTRTLSALGLDTGLAHMEWFRREDGSVAISEVGARPPGAQFTTLLSHAHDTDMYADWSRLSITDEFTPPTRKWAVGAAYLRGQGNGRVVRVTGLDRAQEEFGSLVADVKLPRAGQQKASSYEGEGFVILKHEETQVVAEALARLVQMVRVELA